MQAKIVGIIGIEGRTGNSFSKFFHGRGCHVYGSDLHTPTTNRWVVEQSDVVMIAVSLNATRVVIKELLPYFREDQLVIDVASRKTGVMEELSSSKAELLSIHQLSAPPDAATWKGEKVVVCRQRLAKWSEWVDGFLLDTEATIDTVTDWVGHDLCMLFEQNLLHVTLIAYASALAGFGLKAEELIRFSTRLSQKQIGMLGRLLTQDAGLYADIQQVNPHSVDLIDAYIAALGEIRQTIVSKERRSFMAIVDRNRSHFSGSDLAAMEKLFEGH